MATLTHVKPAPVQERTQVFIDSSVPAPFPAQAYQKEQRRQELLDELAHEELELDLDPFADQSVEGLQAVDDASAESDGLQSSSHSQGAQDATSNELLPSLVYVQQSCLMALNNLLSGVLLSPTTWQPILPPRRHSMPSRPENTAANEPSSALQILLANLRNNGQGQMSEASSSSADDLVLINELQRRVDSISQDLLCSDARLARALISLLAHANRLSVVDPTLSGSIMGSTISLDVMVQQPHADIYGELSRQVLDLQNKRLDQEIMGLACATSPQRKVEVSLLWSKIDQELETVSYLCRQQNEPVPRPYSPGQLPPEYEYDETDEEDLTLLPEYENGSQGYAEKEKVAGHSYQHAQTSDAVSEKMRMDLEAVTMAIDRLYLVAPQLHNQRVELRKSKLEELERARLAGPSPVRKADRVSKGKEKERDVRELERIIDMVGKASSRRLDDQSVSLVGDLQTRIERAKQRDNARREAFVEHLLEHSDSRRIASQDAVFQPKKTRSSDALLTLPEFINEQFPAELQQDPNALLTLSEIVKEPPPSQSSKSSLSPDNSKSNKLNFRSLGKRSRSLSAPPLAWLIPSLGRSGSPLRHSQSSPDNVNIERNLTVRYVAEHHENLNHVLVFLGVDEGMVPGVDLEADVLPCVGDPALGDKLVLRCGSSISAPLSLPVPVSAGKANIRVQGGHYEIKFPIPAPSSSPGRYHPSHRDPVDSNGDQVGQLLDAARITEMEPTSFICASCSSALIQPQSAGVPYRLTYQDLPSEYWAELLEAWMCHQDQKLADRVAQHGRGFWPKPGQAFVGGSYLLFDESVVVHSNLRILESNKGDEWRRVQCICGAIVGRCQSHSTNDETASSVYRIPKYALRPVSLTAEPSRVPFSAFILEDMLELVRAHATYRFIILDEEEERPRLLIWLFKPHMRLAYATTAQFSLPRTGSVHASKVLFKILPAGPEASPYMSSPGTPSPPSSPSLDSILQKHPGFPQAERLLYPRDVVHRLTALLRESNTAYPMGVRVMTGLLTGWLRKT